MDALLSAAAAEGGGAPLASVAALALQCAEQGALSTPLAAFVQDTVLCRCAVPSRAVSLALVLRSGQKTALAT